MAKGQASIVLTFAGGVVGGTVFLNTVENNFWTGLLLGMFSCVVTMLLLVMILPVDDSS